jgi:hypothetical protein
MKKIRRAWGGAMLKNFVLVVLFVFGLNNPAKADYIATYDWILSAYADPCDGGPGCLGFRGGTVYEVGTFTIDSPTDLLGPSGILNTSTPNYDAIVADITSVTTTSATSEFPSIDPALTNFYQGLTGEVAVPISYSNTNCPPNECMNGVFYGSDGGFATVSYSVAAVPEPPTWALMLAGFAGLIGLGRGLIQRNSSLG